MDDQSIEFTNESKNEPKQESKNIFIKLANIFNLKHMELPEEIRYLNIFRHN